jgi:hypothetical protein
MYFISMCNHQESVKIWHMYISFVLFCTVSWKVYFWISIFTSRLNTHSNHSQPLKFISSIVYLFCSLSINVIQYVLKHYEGEAFVQCRKAIIQIRKWNFLLFTNFQYWELTIHGYNPWIKFYIKRSRWICGRDRDREVESSSPSPAYRIQPKTLKGHSHRFR